MLGFCETAKEAFIDRDGKIAKVHRGYHSSLEAAIEEQLQKML